VNSRLSAVPEAQPSGREGCELLSFELPEGEAGVGIQNSKVLVHPNVRQGLQKAQEFGTPKVSLAGSGVLVTHSSPMIL
jgi:hypothetical protein